MITWFIARLSIVLGTLLGVPGARFAWFGLACARAAQRAGFSRLSDQLSITPVNCIRYFEFDEMRRALPNTPGLTCLDVSSPRLFSAWVLAHRPDCRVEIINPDAKDVKRTQELLTSLSLGAPRVALHQTYARHLPWPDGHMDVVWCISVLEHIPIPEDQVALAEMWRLLKPGGVLLLTVPVAKTGYDEMRHDNAYGLDMGGPTDAGMHFFQRWYDQNTLQSRILDALDDAEVLSQSFFGERIPGWFAAYEKDWMRRGAQVTRWDALLMAVRMKRFTSLATLRGMGVITLTIQKCGTGATA